MILAHPKQHSSKYLPNLDYLSITFGDRKSLERTLKFSLWNLK